MTTPPADGMPTTRGTNFYLADPNLAFVCAAIMRPEDFAMHRVILGAGVVIMEGLTNLGALPRRRVEFAAPFYKIAGTEGAPARFFATV